MFNNKFGVGILKHPGYNVGGGIGEAALIGAAFSGGKALMTGEDPLQAALLGGITGGAMSGVMGAIPGVGSAGVSAGTEAVDQATKEALTQGTIQNGVIQGANTGLNVAGAGGMGSQGIAAYNGAVAPNFASNVATNMPAQGIAGMPGSMTPYQAAPIGMNQGITQVAPASSANIGVPTQYGVQTTPGTAAEISPASNTPVTPKAPFVGLKEAINPEAGGMMEEGLDYAIKHPYITAGGAGAVFGALNPKKIEDPNANKKEEKSPLAGYNHDDFTAYQAPQPNPYPQAQYTDYYKYGNQGGVMKSYAEGGIADLAAGGAMAGAGYPQGLIQSSSYGTPSQEPMSNDVVTGGYEPAINTYTGSRVGPGMAEGGIASYANGGFTVNPSMQNFSTPNAAPTVSPLQYYNGFNNATGIGMGYNNMNGISGIYGNYMGPGSNSWINQLNSKLATNDSVSSFNPAEFQSYNPNYAEGGTTKSGVASYAFGGATGSPVYYDSNTGQYYTDSGSPIFGNSSRTYINSDGSSAGSGGLNGLFGMGSKTGNLKVDPNMGRSYDTPSDHYQSQYSQQAPLTQYNGPQGGEGHLYTLADSVPLVAATNPGIAGNVAAGVGKAGGGSVGYSLGGYAAGGNPRLLKGPGDGMSDNIPATIGDRQPARLADGEFVVPADVVSHLGNGSTDAGAKHLYNMMDKVRKARTGRAAQGKQINPNKFMPA